MELKVSRYEKTLTSTVGRFFVNGEQICWSLEDRDRGLTQTMGLSEIKSRKVKGVTAIPKGKYRVEFTVSPKFKNKSWAMPYGGKVPLIADVPGYDGVRIHPLNTAEQTEGCIGVGDYDARKADWISNSTENYLKLLNNYLVPAFRRGEAVYITIE